MGTVSGVDIRLGQVWRTRSGEVGRITSTTAGLMFPILAVIDGVPQSYTTTGHWYGTKEPHARDLVELIHDVAGDEHQALTFHPLTAGESCCGKDCVGCRTPLVPTRESVEFVEGVDIPVSDIDQTDAPLFADGRDPVAPGKHAPAYEAPGAAPLPMSVEMLAEEPDTVLGVPADPQFPDVYEGFPEAHYGHDLRPGDGMVGVPTFIEPLVSIDPGRTNPKDSIGDKKAAMHLLSPIAEIHWMIGQYAGMLKYGAWNWRAAGVRSSVYISAARRHLMGYLSGEEYDPVDGSHHLGNVMACAAILLEASAIGKLVDDRPPSFSHRPTLAWAEDRMAQLKVQYADKAPRHYTIADNVECGVAEHQVMFERRQADDTEGGAA